MDKNTYIEANFHLNFENYLINGLNFKFTDIQASFKCTNKRLKYFIKKRKLLKILMINF